MPQKDDFWTLNGSPNFSYMPGFVLGIEDPVPIRLQVGTDLWGETHVGRKHATFVKQNSVGALTGQGVPWIVWRKLQQSGPIYTTEEDGKLKISLTLSPSALLVLRMNEKPNLFFGITTLYTRDTGLDGSHVGRYIGMQWPRQAVPTFVLQPSLVLFPPEAD